MPGSRAAAAAAHARDARRSRRSPARPAGEPARMRPELARAGFRACARGIRRTPRPAERRRLRRSCTPRRRRPLRTRAGAQLRRMTRRRRDAARFLPPAGASSGTRVRFPAGQGGVAVQQRELVGEQAGTPRGAGRRSRTAAPPRRMPGTRRRAWPHGHGAHRWSRSCRTCHRQQLAAALVEQCAHMEERLEPAPNRLRDLRTPLAIAPRRPWSGVYRCRIRSASP